MVSSAVLESYAPEAYYETVEALKPPDSDSDDGIHKPSDEEQSRCNLHTPTSSEDVVKSEDIKEEVESTTLPQIARDPRPTKRRRS